MGASRKGTPLPLDECAFRAWTTLHVCMPTGWVVSKHSVVSFSPCHGAMHGACTNAQRRQEAPSSSLYASVPRTAHREYAGRRTWLPWRTTARLSAQCAAPPTPPQLGCPPPPPGEQQQPHCTPLQKGYVRLRRHKALCSARAATNCQRLASFSPACVRACHLRLARDCRPMQPIWSYRPSRSTPACPFAGRQGPSTSLRHTALICAARASGGQSLPRPPTRAPGASPCRARAADRHGSMHAAVRAGTAAGCECAA